MAGERLVVVLFLLGAVTAHHGSLHDLAQSNIALSQRLYKYLSRQEGNLVFSPLALQTVLSSTYLGAKGNTAKQLEEGLALNVKAIDRMPEGFQILFDRFKNYRPNLTVDVATALYHDQSISIKEKFLDSARANFRADVTAANFKQNSRGAETEINKWVSERTEGKISSILPAESLSDRTRLVLVNALRFSGVWENQFFPQVTAPKEFHGASGQVKEVPMMRQILSANVANLLEQDATLISLPYQGKNARLLLLVPKKKTGLSQLENNLGGIDFEEIDEKLSEDRIILMMPKFKISRSQQLQDLLKQLGIVDIFDENKSDLSGVADIKLKVDDVVHAATIDVDENGTEATATAVVELEQPLSSVETIVLDRPFLFALQEKYSEALLFLGRYSEPE